MKLPKKTRGQNNCNWIENYCLIPFGPDKGKRVILTFQEQEVIRAIYDGDNVSILEQPVTGPLGAYLALLHTCGIEAPTRQGFCPRIGADIFTVWNAAGEEAREVLRREGSRIVCPELGTCFPIAA
jgi:hypothetical protein